MNINIREFYEKLKAKRDQERADCRSKKAEIENKISPVEEKKTALITNLNKKQQRMKIYKEDDKPNPELEEELKELSRDIRDKDAELSQFQHEMKKIDEPPVISSNFFHKADQMCKVLEDVYKCSEAVEINSLSEHIATFPVRLEVNDADCDEIGHPIRCSVLFCNDDWREIKIRPSKRFAKNFRPEPLRWLPKSIDYEEDEPKSESGMLAYIDRELDRLILTTNLLRWSDTTDLYGNKSKLLEEYDIIGQNLRVKREEDNFSDIADSLPTLLDEMLEKEGGEIDLGKSYPDNALMARVLSRILPFTNTEQLFFTCSEKLTSPKIYERIKDHWDGIKKAPWSDDIKGTLALLKHLLESGERAKFWCKDFENHYGFRLRSRDHDWLVGEIYVGAEVSPSSDTTSIQLVGPAYGDIIARIGDLFIRVERTKD